MRLRPDCLRLTLLFTLLGGLAGCASCRLPPPAGGEIVVNTRTDGDQWYASVGRSASGETLVVWLDSDAADHVRGVYGQRYSAAGRPRGREFQVHTDTSGVMRRPRVATNAAGASVVVWQRQRGTQIDVVARIYRPNGRPRGPEIMVRSSATNANDEPTPDVAVDAAGAFVVLWAGGLDACTVQSLQCLDIFGRRFGADGQADGPEFRVNSTRSNNQLGPAIVFALDGGLVAAWSTYEEATVFARRLTALGDTVGPEFRVPTAPLGYASQVALAAMPGGGVAAVWTQGEPGAYRIFLRRFDGSDAPTDRADVPVSDDPTAAHSVPRVAADAAGTAVVVWQRGLQPTADVYVRRFPASGAAGPAVLLGTTTALGQERPAVAVDAAGRAVAVWQSEGADGSYTAVVGRWLRE